ncbi:MAG: 5'-methylthioadenosine/adenosylhomocysteine nucleosidase [Bacillota bacterium]
MKKIGVIGALPVEIELLKSKMTIEKTVTVANRTFYCGVIGNVEVVLTQSGIGKVNSASCAQVLCSVFGVDTLINTGISGALDSCVDVCDMVVSKDLAYHDFNADFVRIGLENFEAFQADPKMVEIAKSVCEKNKGDAKVFVGRIATGDEFVATRDRKNEIFANTNALCVEMEGAAIAHVAVMNNVPFVVLRCVSDNADDNAELTYEQFEPIAANKCANILVDILKSL